MAPSGCIPLKIIYRCCMVSKLWSSGGEIIITYLGCIFCRKLGLGKWLCSFSSSIFNNVSQLWPLRNEEGESALEKVFKRWEEKICWVKNGAGSTDKWTAETLDTVDNTCIVGKACSRKKLNDQSLIKVWTFTGNLVKENGKVSD